MTFPKRVTIMDVGPRDGLQNEKQALEPATKIALVEKLAVAGVPIVEAGAFVSPKWVPQMAGSEEVFAGIERRAGTRYAGLVPNMKGYERAREAGVDVVGVIAAASETFSQRNTNCSIEESFARMAPVVEAAAADGVPVRGYMSCALGCPYEGDIDPSKVVALSERLIAIGCESVFLSDTIGVGTPARAQALFERAAERIPREKIGLHFHDTYGQALANLLACLEKGATLIDSSVAGLGGCPYAPGAAGNVATEDVVYMLDGLGIETGIDLDALAATGRFISDTLGRPPASRVARALAAKADRAAAE